MLAAENDSSILEEASPAYVSDAGEHSSMSDEEYMEKMGKPAVANHAEFNGSAVQGNITYPVGPWSWASLRRHRCKSCSMCIQHDCGKCLACITNQRQTSTEKEVCLLKVRSRCGTTWGSFFSKKMLTGSFTRCVVAFPSRQKCSVSQVC